MELNTFGQMNETINQKLRFLSLYPLCTCIIQDTTDEKFCVVDFIEGFDYVQGKVICERINYDPELIKLNLKPISMLTLEDAHQFARMLELRGDSFRDHNIVETMLDILVTGAFHEMAIPHLAMNGLISKLREYNYAYAFEGIPVETQEELGWVVLGIIVG